MYTNSVDIEYCADNNENTIAVSLEQHFYVDRILDRDFKKDIRWRPSIHMPRWASRITLEITGVRVERLQEIDNTDSIREGIERCKKKWHDEIPFGCVCAVYNFKSLWDSINGADESKNWGANPWVWVIEFERIEP